MIFAVFDPSPLTVCINCSFFTFIFAVLLPGLSRLLIMSMVFFKMAAVRHLRFLNVRNTSCWSGVLFTIMYVRTYAKISVTRKFCDFSYVLFAISL